MGMQVRLKKHTPPPAAAAAAPTRPAPLQPTGTLLAPATLYDLKFVPEPENRRDCEDLFQLAEKLSRADQTLWLKYEAKTITLNEKIRYNWYVELEKYYKKIRECYKIGKPGHTNFPVDAV